MRVRNIIFMSLVGIIFLSIIISSLVRGEKEISIIENRSLSIIPTFSLDKFLETDYQSNLEVALTDQIIYGDRVKLLYNQIKNNNLDHIVSLLKRFEEEKLITSSIEESIIEGPEENKSKIYLESNTIHQEMKSERDRIKRIEKENIERLISMGRLPQNSSFEMSITPRGSGHYELDETKHLIVRKRTSKDADKLFESKANNYNLIAKNYPDLSYYCYYIESDVDIDFINGVIDHELVNLFFEKLNSSINKTALYLNEPTDYQNYFYKTDHHWDVKGQLKGYEDILWILNDKEFDTLDIETKLIEGATYNGSKSRTISDFKLKDDFSILISPLDDHEVYINGVKSNYGLKKRYSEGKYSKDIGVNHYGIANGGDFGLVEYRFNQPDKGNILVFVESFSNPVNEFIASHYNNAYFVDLRYYDKSINPYFDFGDFVDSKNIDDVMFMGYYFFYANDRFLIND